MTGRAVDLTGMILALSLDTTTPRDGECPGAFFKEKTADTVDKDTVRPATA